MSKIIICDDAAWKGINKQRLENRKASLTLDLENILNQLKTV